MIDYCAPVSFGIHDFEKWVFGGDLENADIALSRIIYAVSSNTPLSVLCPLGSWDRDTDRVALYNRLAAAITALLSRTDYQPSAATKSTLLLLKDGLHLVFSASSFRNMDHILYNLGLMDNQKRLLLKGDYFGIERLLLCLTPETDINIRLSLLADLHPELSKEFVVGLSASLRIHFSPRSAAMAQHFVDDAGVLENVAEQRIHHVRLATAWMLCSYFSGENRHDIKKAINVAYARLAAGVLERAGKTVLRTGQTTGSGRRKRLLVGLEVMHENHAMCRCYLPELLSLKQKYDVVLLAEKDKVDAFVTSHFENVVLVDNQDDIESYLKAILDVAPDIIFYPSVGMSFWVPVLANIRLASIQLASVGHPASTFSPHMDYLIGASDSEDAAAFLQSKMTEKLLLVRGEWGYGRSGNALPKRRGGTRGDGVVRIAINSSFLKITREFVQACREIERRCTRPVEFRFYPATGGIHTDVFLRLVEKELNRVRVFSATDYPSYVRALAECDLALGTFPFGGTNTNIDLAVLGIPKVALERDYDLASHTDRAAWVDFDLPTSLSVSTVEEYVATAVSLVEDQPLREELARAILACDPERIFFERSESNVNTRLLEIFTEVDPA